MKKNNSRNLLTKSLLVAASLLSVMPVAKAYDQTGWDVDENSYSGFDYTGYSGSLIGTATLNPLIPAIRAGVYQATGSSSSWYGNDRPTYILGIYSGSEATYMAQSMDLGASAPYVESIDGDSQSGSYSFFGGPSNTYLLPLDATRVRYSYRYDQSDGDGGFYSSGFAYSERSYQVARTGPGPFGTSATSAFASDNQSYGSNYSVYSNRNVLPPNALVLDGAEGYTAANIGSVVRTGDIKLGNLGAQDGLFAKDAGWLDIRGSLTISSTLGQLYIRDAEITSTIFEDKNSYTNDADRTTGSLYFESGILSVRDYFAHDMFVSGDQTVGFRDGVVNANDINIDGEGYTNGYFRSDDVTVYGGVYGGLRSISGDNVQNGNIGIGWLTDTRGVIGVDEGSTLTINGIVNGVNGGGSSGGSDLEYNVDGTLIQNGIIASGVDNVSKYGSGEVRLTTANSYSGDMTVEEGVLTVTVAGALSSPTTSTTHVESGASLYLEAPASLTPTPTGFNIAANVEISGDGVYVEDIEGNIGAIFNSSGNNTITGSVLLSDVYATIAVNESTSLTIAGNLGETSDFYGTLAIGTLASPAVGLTPATTSTFTVTGHTGTLDEIIKILGGTATIAQANAELNKVDVYDGTLRINGSVGSSALAPYSILTKYGAGKFELNGTHYYTTIDLYAGTTDILGTLNSVTTIEVEGTSALRILAGAIINGDIETEDNSDLNAAVITVSGTLNGDIDLNRNSTVEVTSGGALSGNIEADDDSLVTLRTGGSITGNVSIFDNAEFIIETGSTHTGDFNAYEGASITVNGIIGEGSLFASNFLLDDGARIKGNGTVNGKVTQTDGSVEPGLSPGILTFGAYTINGGELEIEIEGVTAPGVAGGYDQLRVVGDLEIGGTAQLHFDMDAGYEAVRGDVFQALANSTGQIKASIGQFNTVRWEDSDSRILFDHSTGRAYGTGLAYGQDSNPFQTFRDYGNNANRREIGRALWMESISYDNSDLGLEVEDENFASTALDPVAAAARTGYKAFILTANDGDSAESATDLGSAAVAVLTASDAGAGLDSLSPEVYAGIADQGTKVARNFVRQTFVVRHRDGATDDWDFEVGYANDELTSNGTSGYNSYATKSNQVTLSASRTLGKEFAVTVAVGSDDGRVTAQNFDAKVKTGTVGLGLTYAPESKIGRFDIAAAISAADWDSNRGGALASEDGQHSFSGGARFTLAPIATNGVTLSPYVGVIYSRSRVNGFTENDVDGTVQLQVDDFKQQSLQSELGVNVAYQFSPQTVITGLASWEHEFRSSGETTLNSEFIEDGVDDTRFTVNSLGFGTDVFRLGLGISYDITALSSASLSYNAVLGSDVSSGREIRANYSVRF